MNYFTRYSDLKNLGTEYTILLNDVNIYFVDGYHSKAMMVYEYECDGLIVDIREEYETLAVLTRGKKGLKFARITDEELSKFRKEGKYLFSESRATEIDTSVFLAITYSGVSSVG